MREIVVVLDPGHGGAMAVGGSSPNRAVGPNGLLEKNVALDLARRVRSILSPELRVVLTRDEDRNLSLRSEEHTSELQSQSNLVCRLLLEKKKQIECLLGVRWSGSELNADV